MKEAIWSFAITKSITIVILKLMFYLLLGKHYSVYVFLKLQSMLSLIIILTNKSKITHYLLFLRVAVVVSVVNITILTI